MEAPPGGDLNRGASLMAMFWTEVPIAMAFVAMRIYSRLKLRSVGYDDWMIVITLVRVPGYTSGSQLIEVFLDSVHSDRHRSDLLDLSWRRTSSLLPRTGPEGVRYQGRLDPPTLQHHGSGDG